MKPANIWAVNKPILMKGIFILIMCHLMLQDRILLKSKMTAGKLKL